MLVAGLRDTDPDLDRRQREGSLLELIGRLGHVIVDNGLIGEVRDDVLGRVCSFLTARAYQPPEDPVLTASYFTILWHPAL